MVTRAVFLDRDGVLNDNVERDGRLVAPTRLEDFTLRPGVVPGLARLKSAGFLLIVVTNQPDLSTGRTSANTLEAMHAVLRRRCAIDEIMICPHVDADDCSCRKPRPGLLLAAANAHGLELSSCFLVGDRWRDIEAGQAVGCDSVLLDHGRSDMIGTACPEAMVASFEDAVEWILARRQAGDARRGVGEVEHGSR